MLTLTLRALRARPLRLAMSALAVTLGVAFLIGVLVFSHGLSSTFHNIVTGSTPDAVVRPAAAPGLGDVIAPSAALDPGLVRRLAALPQVARADGEVQALGTTLLGSDGRAVGSGGAPTIALNHDGAPNMDGGQVLQLSSGRWPQGLGEVVLDEDAAHHGHYGLGDVVTVLTPASDRQVRLRLVGIAQFNGGGTAGATLVVLSTPGAQHLLLHGRDGFSRIALTAAPGVSQEQLVAAARPLLPVGFEAVTGDDVAKASQDVIGVFLDAISAFLLIFATIAVVVSAFIIVNTFTILVAQRTRELALLRALGASRRQVSRSVLLEALVVGSVASTLGIGVGWALARLLAAGFGTFGLTISSSSLLLTRGAVVTGYAVGIGVTAVASYAPARRAGRTAPLAAFRAGQAAPTRPSLLRVAGGVLGVLIGTAGAYVGVGPVHPRPGPGALWVGVAAVVWIVSAAALMPVLGMPVLWLGRHAFARVFGVAGRLAGDNARRDPRRTGATAAALMIGLALVSTVAVLAASLNATIDDSIDHHFSADFRAQGHDGRAFPATLGDRMARVPGVSVVSREQDLVGSYAGSFVVLAGVDDQFVRTRGLTATAGTGALTPGGALVTADFARQHHVGVGQSLVVTTAGKAIAAHVTGIVEGTAATAQVIVPMTTLAAAGIPHQDTALMVLIAPGADPAAVRAGLDRAAAPAPYVQVDDKQQFAQQLHDRVDRLIYLVDGLLALAVVIAVLGIVNTLSLSVLERTRELGLLRAVGMSRAQVRRMVLLESVAIALLGAVVGLGLGVLAGVLLRQSLATDLTSLGIPLGGLAGFLGAAVVIGVLAAVAPGIRAARMSPLTAAAED